MSITAEQEEEVDALVAAATEILNEDRKFVQINVCTHPAYDAEAPLRGPWDVHLFALDAGGRVHWNLRYWSENDGYEWTGWEEVEDDRNC